MNQPNEKWWNHPDYRYESDFGSILPDIPKIVAEAERRGERKAWEEIKKMLEMFPDPGLFWLEVGNILDAKLNALK